MKKSFFEDTYKRLFFLYGNTDDEFCSNDLKFRKLSKLIYFQLKSRGYERIALYNAKYKIFSYDKSSYNLILDSETVSSEKKGLKSSPLIPKGPLGNNSLLLNREKDKTSNKTESSAIMRDGVYSFGLMNDVNVVSKLDEIMCNEDIKTAVIITDGFDFLNNFEQNARRQMASNLQGWLNFGHKNDNISIFIFPEFPNEQLISIIQRNSHWQFLHSKMFKTDNHLNDSMYNINLPQNDEIENVIHHYRLKYDYRIDWLTLKKYLPKISSKVLSEQTTLREFARNLKLKTSLNEDVIIELAGSKNIEESAENRLSKMRGINVIKDKIDDFINEVNEQRSQLDKNREIVSGGDNFFTNRTSISKKKTIPINLHLVLKGAPGTGKTTVARLLGEIFREKGLLMSGHLVKASRSDLVAGYVGQTALQTSRLIDQAMGGVFFVDEAYSLVEKGGNDFGTEALETILEAMENRKGEFSVIFAGYPDEIDKLIKSNPGFKSRFSEHNIIIIPDFDSKTLFDILEDTIIINKKYLEPKFANILPSIIENWHDANHHDKSFGNARTIKEDIYKGMDINRRKRTKNGTTSGRDQFVLEDIPEILKKYVSDNKKDSLENVLEELNNMTGLESIKTQVKKLVQQEKFKIIREKQGLKVSNNESMHMLFVGNPGTGKTTVAKLMGKLLHGLNVLPSDKLIDVSAKDLIGSHVGESEKKANELIEKAMGGVLFIDEIYGLTQGSLGQSFGADVINNVLVPVMTKDEGKLLIIGAGYTGNMIRFLENNPGLDRRFSRKISFEDFTPEELLSIIKNHAELNDYIIKDTLNEPLLILFTKTKQLKGANFGNAGTVITCFNLMKENHGERLLKLGHQNIKKIDLKKFLIEDIPDKL